MTIHVRDSILDRLIGVLILAGVVAIAIAMVVAVLLPTPTPFVGILPQWAGSRVLPIVEYDESGQAQVLCSAVVVGQAPARILTAAHCFEDEPGEKRVDGRSFRVVRTSGDLILLEPDIFYPHWKVVTVSTKAPSAIPVAAIGFPLGKPIPIMTQGHVAGASALSVYLDMQLLTGMSGGAVLDEHGDLVSIVSECATDRVNSVCFGPTPESIAAFLGEGQ